VDAPGHEAARLVPEGGGWRLSGTAVFAHDGRPCRLDYTVSCRADWSTASASVSGRVGDELIHVQIEADERRNWRMNGAPVPPVAGCTDVDLNFSPSTNLLPIRRLALSIGDEADVSSAWLRFPSFALERLDQKYRRIERSRYRYESAGGRFSAELEVNAAGFVTRYADIWHAEME
jgi:hypothetical protein